MQGIRRTCFTIVSKNYLAFARTLAKSFSMHHPDDNFIVVLVDEVGDDYSPDDEPFDVLTIADIGLPAEDFFKFQYTILELNTAVKPFVFLHLFRHAGYDQVIYLDPDIMVFRPLEEITSALDTSDLVLTPHMRVPPSDSASPTELQILQSGTYNLGFGAFRNTHESLSLLTWWAERLYDQCVVNIPVGLFVDQKWMDLAVAYCEKVSILRTPALNVAYWNLHERELSQQEDGSYLVDGLDLGFFHFSGFDPRWPTKLSKHQDRHNVLDNPALTAICMLYRDNLMDAGFRTASEYEYAFGELPNGIPVTPIINDIVLKSIRAGLKFPSPYSDPNGFCDWITTPNASYAGFDVAPIITALLTRRPDVAAHFPESRSRKDDKGLRNWLANSGSDEEKLTELFEGFGDNLTTECASKTVLDVYEARPDLQEAFDGAFQGDAVFDEFLTWLEIFGEHEEEITPEQRLAFAEARDRLRHTVDTYFGRQDLLQTFPAPWREKQLDQLCDWLTKNLPSLPNLTQNDVLFFRKAVSENKLSFIKLCLVNNREIHKRMGGPPCIFRFNNVMTFLRENQASQYSRDVSKWLVGEDGPSAVSQILAYWDSEPRLQRCFKSPDQSTADLSALSQFVAVEGNLSIDSKIAKKAFAKLEDEIHGQAWEDNDCLVLGYLDAPTGMGASARSLAHLLKSTDLGVGLRPLPSFWHEPRKSLNDLADAALYGKADARVPTAFVVANANDIAQVERIVPDLWTKGKHIVGYWVWETEALPGHYAGMAQSFDAIWSPSKYSANAISRGVSAPVSVVPHTLDFSLLAAAKSSRDRFGIPEDKFAFGYFFDSKSELERKNPEGLIEAYRNAFGDSSDVVLVLKVNTPQSGNFRYEQLKAMTHSENILWIEKTLSTPDTYDLMASLDCYVSLHRSEGFGLTMAEAMALRKPVIATAYSGNMDFMDHDTAKLVAAKPVQTTRAFGPYPTGTKWADPDTQVAAKLMREVVSEHGSPIVATRAQEHIQELLSPEKVAAAALRALEELKGHRQIESSKAS